MDHHKLGGIVGRNVRIINYAIKAAFVIALSLSITTQ